MKSLIYALPLALGCCSAAFAGQGCETQAPRIDSVRAGLQLAQRSYAALDASDAEVAIIARAGQDLRKYRLQYSHLAFVWRDHPAGRWTVIHLLNECGTDRSDLYAQGLGDFFTDDLFEYRALIMIPSPAVQERLAQRLRAHGERTLYSERYNVVAYPYATDDENCIQWALEFYAASVAIDFPLSDRASAQAWLRAAGYQPTTLEIPLIERLGADLGRVNVSFEDQPFDRRMEGLIDTSTVESMERFVRARDPGLTELTLAVDPQLSR